MSLTLYLLRHGRTMKVGGEIGGDADGPRRYIGRTDVTLDAMGLAQAHWWREGFGPGRFERVLCSDLRRSLDTARVIAAPGAGVDGEATPVKIMSALREIDLGQWEGLAMDEVRRDFPELYAARGRDMAGFRPPDGESFGDLELRVRPVVETLVDECLNEDRDVLLVGHAGVNRVVLCRALGLPLADLFRLAQDHAGLSAVRYGPDGPRLLLLNRTPESP